MDQLEGLYFGKDGPASSVALDGDEKPLTLDARMQKISSNCTQIESSIKGYHNYRKLYQKAEGLLDLSTNGHLTSLTSAEATAAKRTLVLHSQGVLLESAGQLEALASLDHVVNPPYLEQISELSKRAEVVNRAHLDRATAAAMLHQQMEETLEQYNSIITLVSSKCVHWDSILSQYEEKAQK